MLLSRRDFEEQYCPIINPFTKEKSYIYEPSQQNITVFQDFLLNKSAWTVKRNDADDMYIAIPGIITSKEALGYIFTQEPWKNNRIIVDIYG